MKTIPGNDSVPEEYIRELLKNVSPFDYTSEYVFIKFLRERKWLKRDCKNNIEYKEVRAQIEQLASLQGLDFEKALLFVKENKKLVSILDYVTAKEELQNKLDSYTAVAIMRERDRNLVQWEVSDEI